jgi:hypothetical protein
MMRRLVVFGAGFAVITLLAWAGSFATPDALDREHGLRDPVRRGRAAIVVLTLTLGRQSPSGAPKLVRRRLGAP